MGFLGNQHHVKDLKLIQIYITLKDSLVGLRVIIRDEVGHVVLSATKTQHIIFSPLIAELMAICKVSALPKGKCLTNLMFEVDYLNAVSLINKVGLNFAPEGFLGDEIS